MMLVTDNISSEHLKKLKAADISTWKSTETGGKI